MPRLILAAPYLIVPLGIALLQWKGIPFWMALFADPVAGVGASVFLEVSALWLWWNARRWSVLAGVVTVLLLAGPVMQVGGPLWSDLTTAAPKAAADARIEANAFQALQDARRAVGLWEAKIEAGDYDRRFAGQYTAAREDLARREADWKAAAGAALATGNADRLGWRTRAEIAGTLAAFLVFQVLVILAIRDLASRAETPRPAPNSAPKPAPNRPENSPQATARQAAPDKADGPESLAMKFAKAHGLENWGAVAEKLKEHPSTFSEFRKGKTGPEVTARITKKLRAE